jgi:hypothetical protein
MVWITPSGLLLQHVLLTATAAILLVKSWHVENVIQLISILGLFSQDDQGLTFAYVARFWYLLNTTLCTEEVCSPFLPRLPSLHYHVLKHLRLSTSSPALASTICSSDLFTFPRSLKLLVLFDVPPVTLHLAFATRFESKGSRLSSLPSPCISSP